MTMEVKGRTIIILGPRCTGKSNLAKNLICKNPVGSGVCVPYKLSSDDQRGLKKYRQEKEKLIAQATKNGVFLVVICEGVSIEDVESIINHCQTKDFFRKIQIVKMDIPEELHDQFRKRNDNEMQYECMMEERKNFEKILKNDFSRPNVIQEIVQNPTKVTFSF